MMMPVYAALERIPDSYIEASRDLGARGLRDTSGRVILPLALPGIVAGSIFTFSLTLGDYITPTLVGGAELDFIGNVVYERHRRREHARSPPRSPRSRSLVMAIYLASRSGSARSRRCDGDARARGSALRIWTVGSSSLFLFIPIVIIVLYAFNASNVQSWPITGCTMQWFSRRMARPRDARALCCRSRPACSRPGSRSCSARWPRSRITASGSSAGRRSRSCSSCRSRCPGSSPGWR